MHLCHHFSGVFRSQHRLHPSPAKVQAIQKAPAPTNITELRAFLGLVNYYHKFLPNLSSTLSPLHILLRKSTKWNWTQNQQIAFDKVKELLQSDALLVHFDSTKPLLVYADASPHGVGAVLAHKMPDNSEKPIALPLVLSLQQNITTLN